MSVGVPRLPYVGGGRAAVAVSVRAAAVVPVPGPPARTEEAVVPLAVVVLVAATVLAAARYNNRGHVLKTRRQTSRRPSLEHHIDGGKNKHMGERKGKDVIEQVRRRKWT